MSATTLSPEYILSLKADFEEDARLLHELPARIETKKRRYEASLLFAPPGFDPNAPPVADEPALPAPVVEVAEHSDGMADPTRRDVTWSQAIAGSLREINAGRTHRDLLAYIKSHFPVQSSAGEKGFYNAITKMYAAGTLEKRKNILFLKETLDRMAAEGKEPPPQSEIANRPGSSGRLVLEVLSEHAAGLSGPELKAVVADRPDAPRSVREHGQYIYNILATLMGAGDVEKADGVYRLTRPNASEIGRTA